jgi:DNA-binding MarR family transcriptional regulator
MTAGLAGQRIDRDALHRYLYRRSDRHHRLKVQAKDLAEELGVSYENFTTILRKMADDGRLRRISGAHNGPKVYLVTPPEDFAP